MEDHGLDRWETEAPTLATPPGWESLGAALPRWRAPLELLAQVLEHRFGLTRVPVPSLRASDGLLVLTWGAGDDSCSLTLDLTPAPHPPEALRPLGRWLSVRPRTLADAEWRARIQALAQTPNPQPRSREDIVSFIRANRE